MRTWAARRSLNPFEQTNAIHGYVTCGSWACHVVVQSVSQYCGTEWASPDVVQLIMKSRTTGCEKAIRDHFVKKKKKKKKKTDIRTERNELYTDVGGCRIITSKVSVYQPFFPVRISVV